MYKTIFLFYNFMIYNIVNRSMPAGGGEFVPAVTGGRRWDCACRAPADTAESLCSAYTYETYHMIFSANVFARGQEGEDHARREVFPLLTPLSLGFGTAP